MRIAKSDLLSPLQSLCKIALGRNSLPVINSILVEATNSTLKLRASNIDEYQTEVVPCEGDLSAICIPARILLELVSAAPDWIDMQIDGNAVKITGAGEAKIACLPAVEFVPEPKDKFVGLGLNLSDLADGIDAVKWAQLDDSSNHTLNSLHVVTSEKSIICEATTMKCLGKFVRQSIASKSNFLIHSPFVSRFTTAIRVNGATLALGEKHIKIERGGGSYLCKLMEDTYLNTKPITDNNRKTLGTINRSAVLLPMQICQSLFQENQTGRTGSVKIEFQPKWARIILNGQNQHHYSDTIVGKFEQADMCVGLDTTVECFKAFKEDELLVETDGDGFGPLILSGKELTTFSSQMRPT